MGLIQKIFGTYSQRELKSIYPIADKIEALEEEYRALTDEQLQAKTPEFKQRLQQGETLDDILPEVLAEVRLMRHSSATPSRSSWRAASTLVRHGPFYEAGGRSVQLATRFIPTVECDAAQGTRTFC